MDASTIIALVSVVIAIGGSAVALAWGVARTIHNSENRTGEKIDSGIKEVHKRIDVLSNKIHDNQTEVIKRLSEHDGRITSVENRVTALEQK